MRLTLLDKTKELAMEEPLYDECEIVLKSTYSLYGGSVATYTMAGDIVESIKTRAGFDAHNIVITLEVGKRPKLDMGLFRSSLEAYRKPNPPTDPAPE